MLTLKWRNKPTCKSFTLVPFYLHTYMHTYTHTPVDVICACFTCAYVCAMYFRTRSTFYQLMSQLLLGNISDYFQSTSSACLSAYIWCSFSLKTTVDKLKEAWFFACFESIAWSVYVVGLVTKNYLYELYIYIYINHALLLTLRARRRLALRWMDYEPRSNRWASHADLHTCVSICM